MSNNITLFQSDPSGSAAGTSQFVVDNFQDVSNPASSNAGLTNTANTNPLALNFANSDTPQYSVKNLYVRDLVLIQDRTKWIKNRPTYIVEFSETWPAIVGYVYGNVRVRNQRQGLCIQLRSIGDGFGITGLARDVSWGINQTPQAAGSANLFTDGVSGATVTFNNAAGGTDNEGINTFLFIKHQAALATNDLHDYRIEANQSVVLSISGVQVYAENSGQNVQANPGSTYINKTLATTSVGVGLTLPILAGPLGAKTLVVKNISNTYSLSTLEPNLIQTIAIGSSGSNLVQVTTGQGASFSAGMGVVVPLGTSYYIGAVQSVSTDTLTMSPTLTFGVSGSMYRAWTAGPTLPIGNTAYILSKTIDVDEQNNFVNPDGFGKSASGNYYFSDPNGKFRLWGSNLSFSQIEGYPGLAFSGATSGFLQLDFFGAALDMEFTGNGILNATFAINGFPSFSMNQGVTGAFRQTIMSDGGPGFNSVVITPGTSLAVFQFTKFNVYDRANPGTSLGVLAQFQTGVNKAYQYTHNATLMSQGPWCRVYGDNLYFSGNWIRGTTTAVAGNVFYAGATNSCVFNLNYFGNDFAILGTFGSSQVVMLDGASVGALANAPFLVPGTTFHSLQFTSQAGTCIISAIDFSSPRTLQLMNNQNVLPLPGIGNIPQVFFQSDTPREAKDGATWCKDINKGLVYLRLAKRWFQLAINQSIDDPNISDLSFVRAFGLATANTTPFVSDNEIFNFVGWVSGTSDSVTIAQAGIGQGTLGINLYAIDGDDTAFGTPISTTRAFNKGSWSAGPTRATPRDIYGICNLNSTLVTLGGAPSGSNIEVFNAVAWTSAGAPPSGIDAYSRGTFNDGMAHWVGGFASGVGQTAHDQYNGTSSSTGTAGPIVSDWTAGTSSAGGMGFIAGSFSGSHFYYVYNGSTWAGFNTMISAVNGDNIGNTKCGIPASGFNSITQKAYLNGGINNAVATTNVTQNFDGNTWFSDVSSVNSRSGCVGGVF